VDYLDDLKNEENLREAYTLARHLADNYNVYLGRAHKPILTPFWELRTIERLTLALYLEQSSKGALNANQMLSYPSGSKLLEGAEWLRSRALMMPAVEDLLAPLQVEGDAKVSFKTTALAYDALELLEEERLNHQVQPKSSNWD
jgi:hypothetical protein